MSSVISLVKGSVVIMSVGVVIFCYGIFSLGLAVIDCVSRVGDMGVA